MLSDSAARAHSAVCSPEREHSAATPDMLSASTCPIDTPARRATDEKGRREIAPSGSYSSGSTCRLVKTCECLPSSAWMSSKAHTPSACE